MVTEACINNVAERNRMQILPYVRVYRELAVSEQPLSFSAVPSGWMRTTFLKLINHILPSKQLCKRSVPQQRHESDAKAIFNFSLLTSGHLFYSAGRHLSVVLSHSPLIGWIIHYWRFIIETKPVCSGHGSFVGIVQILQR